MNKAKVLLIDIETAPIKAYVWGLWENNVSLNMIESDWHLLSWSAKWLGEAPSKTMYMDQRNAKNIEDDSKILKGMWDLLNEADVVISQNGRKFDHKKLNARFILQGMKPPSPYQTIDTLVLAKKHFAFTSNKLEYMSSKLCTKYKKLKHAKFSGFELWDQCMKGNLAAWNEMKKYNMYDVLALEELYTKLQPWDNTVNFDVFDETTLKNTCGCGKPKWTKDGFKFSKSGKFQRYHCMNCGSYTSGKTNLLTPAKKASLRK